MSNIELHLKTYDELVFEITTLNTNKYLLEQKVKKQKEVLDKIKEYIKENGGYNEEYKCCTKPFNTLKLDDLLDILKGEE